MLYKAMRIAGGTSCLMSANYSPTHGAEWEL